MVGLRSTFYRVAVRLRRALSAGKEPCTTLGSAGAPSSTHFSCPLLARFWPVAPGKRRYHQRRRTIRSNALAAPNALPRPRALYCLSSTMRRPARRWCSVMAGCCLPQPMRLSRTGRRCISVWLRLSRVLLPLMRSVGRRLVASRLSNCCGSIAATLRTNLAPSVRRCAASISATVCSASWRETPESQPVPWVCRWAKECRRPARGAMGPGCPGGQSAACAPSRSGQMPPRWRER